MLRNIFTRLFKKDLPPQAALFSNKFYSSVYDLPFKLWVKITVTKDLKYLIVEGKPTTDELFTAWNIINDQYRELSSDIDTNYSFDLEKELVTDDSEIAIALTIVNQLSIRRNEELIKILKSHFNFRFDYVDLNADLKKTLTALQGRIMHLKLKDKELKDLKVDQPQKEYTEFDFIEQLVVLSEDNKYRIDMNQITVAEYIALYNKFKVKVDYALKNQSHV